jgi:hypothetical protein
MNDLITRQRELIDTSGLGLLPGIGLAFALALVTMVALVLDAWWVTIAVLFVLFAITALIAAVVLAVMRDDGDEGGGAV